MKWLLYEQHDSPTIAAVLDGPGGLGERAARDHRDQPLLRAHDVQGHEDDRHEEHRRGPAADRGAGEDPRRDARGDGGDAGEAPPGRDRRPAEARELDGALPRARQAVRRARPEAARDDRQGPARPDLHEERRRGPERVHERGPDRLLPPHPEEPARAVGVARVRPAAEPGLPRVLLGAGRRLRGAPARRRVDAARQVRRGVRTRSSGRRAPTSGRWWAGPPTSRCTRSPRRSSTSPPTTPPTTSPASWPATSRPPR